jgi:ribosomal protein S18 acetylase RimI-like enzyme
LWELDGRLVAWSWHEAVDARDPAELDFQAWTGDAALDASLSRQILEGSMGADAVHVWSAEDDVGRIALLEESGFGRVEPVAPSRPKYIALSQYQRTLDGVIPASDLPPGYRIRPLRGHADLSARVEVHRAAFAPSRMALEKYERLMTLPLYRLEDDLVVEGPDGRFAAFALAWWDPVAQVGEFEPVGTHPDHQRRGLGKALLSHALRRYRSLGARCVQVYSSAENLASEALYRSVGFGRVALHVRYRGPGHDEEAPVQSPG